MHQGHFFPLQLQMLLNLQRTTEISRRALGQPASHHDATTWTQEIDLRPSVEKF
jgi:hypothetical protein